jgi:DNA-binding protein H-NS
MGRTMTKSEFESMSIDELWALHQEMVGVLAAKINAERSELEKRLHQIGVRSDEVSAAAGRKRRPYPRVLPKYRNPSRPHETWSGRGKKPHWVIKQLKSGKKMDDFRIGRD